MELSNINITNVVEILTAVGTFGMCFFSYLNIRYTQKQATYTNKIIDTKNLLYEALLFKERLLLERLRDDIKILQVLVCLFLLKHKTRSDNEIECDYCFNARAKTNEDFNKIFDVYNVHKKSVDVHDLLDHKNKLIDLVVCYLGQKSRRDRIALDNGTWNSIDFIIKEILSSGETFFFRNAVENKWLSYYKYTEDESQFRSFVKRQRLLTKRCVAEAFFNDIYRKFDIPIELFFPKGRETILDEYSINKSTLENIDYLLYKCVRGYDSDEEELCLYEKMDNLWHNDINDGVVAKISDDLECAKFYYLPAYSIVKRWYFAWKKKKLFDEIYNFFSQEIDKNTVEFNITTPAMRDKQEEPLTGRLFLKMKHSEPTIKKAKHN